MYMIGWAATWDADGITVPAPALRPALLALEQPGLRRLIDTAAPRSTRASAVKSTDRPAQLAHDEAPWLFLLHGMDIYGVSRAVADWEPTSDESTSTVMLRHRQEEVAGA